MIHLGYVIGKYSSFTTVSVAFDANFPVVSPIHLNNFGRHNLKVGRFCFLSNHASFNSKHAEKTVVYFIVP